MNKRRAYYAYKRLSKDLFQTVAFPRELSNEDVVRYIRLYSQYKRCATLRAAYRDTHVDFPSRDRGHELAIEAARRRSHECESILQELFHGQAARGNPNPPE